MSRPFWIGLILIGCMFLYFNWVMEQPMKEGLQTLPDKHPVSFPEPVLKPHFQTPEKSSETEPAPPPLPQPPEMTKETTAEPEKPVLPKKPAEVSLVDQKVIDMLKKVLAEVTRDLDQKVYGEPLRGELTYNIVYLFQQSLNAFVAYLKDPGAGPDLQIQFEEEFSGRYQFGSEQIRLGSLTLDKGVGRYLVTLFHEYQHHLYHQIYGTPQPTDIVRKYYNEAAAYLFEMLLATYIPGEYFDEAHRGSLPIEIRRKLEENLPDDVLEQLLRMLVGVKNEGKLFYTFLEPLERGIVRSSEIVEAIDNTFTPNAGYAKELQKGVKNAQGNF